MPQGTEPAIEQSLALVRADTEREIADHRLRLYAFSLVVVLAVKLLTRTPMPWTPPLMLLAGSAVAWGLRLHIRQRGCNLGLIVAASVFDLGLTAGIFVLSQPSYPVRADTAAWLTVLAVAFMFLLTIASLRLSVASAVATTVAACAVYAATALHLFSPHPAVFVATGMMLFMCWFALTVIRRTERNLELFARYQQLRRFLPGAAVERVLKDDLGDALAVGGRLVEVTLLSSDLRGFTAMSEKLAPEEVVRQLNAYHATMLEQIDRFGGSLDKFIGDGSLVVFGLAASGPPLEDAGARAAVECAQAMLQALEALNAERAREGLAPLRMGLGVHTGQVVAGNIGAPGRRLEFTVIGDAVNTAARLEGATKELGCPLVISQTTAARLSSKEGLRALAPVQLRGKEEALPVFTVDPAAEPLPASQSARP